MTYYIEVKSPRVRPIVISRSNVRAKQDPTMTPGVDTSPSGDNDVNIEMESDEIEINTRKNYNGNNEVEVSNKNDEEENEPTTSIYDYGVEITFDDDALNEDDPFSETRSFEDDALVDQQINDTVESEEEDFEFHKIQGHYQIRGC